MSNQDMMVTLFVNMMKNMSEPELKKALERAKTMMSPSEYTKLQEIINDTKSK